MSGMIWIEYELILALVTIAVIAVLVSSPQIFN